MKLLLASTLLFLVGTSTCSAISDESERRGLRRTSDVGHQDNQEAERSLGSSSKKKKKEEEEQEVQDPILMFMQSYERIEVKHAEVYLKQAESVQKTLEKENRLYEERRKNLKEELRILEEKEKDLEEELKDLSHLIKESERDVEHVQKEFDEILEKITSYEEEAETAKKTKEEKDREKALESLEKWKQKKKEVEGEYNDAQKVLQQYVSRLETAIAELKKVRSDVVKLTFEYNPQRG
jgi:chromosome segregation ATPase